MQPSRIEWQPATIERTRVETPRVKTFSLSLQHPFGFRAGQHVDVRLTAPDGFQAQRSYSIASAPESQDLLDITVELMPGGVVSPYFHEAAAEGDRIELRGPIGGPFTWSHDQGGPLLLMAAGSGIVPIMSMLRHRRASGAHTQAALLYSSRSWEDVIYRSELAATAAVGSSLAVLHTLTRGQPRGWSGNARRIDAEMIEEAASRVGEVGRAYICGNDGFVETAANLLVDSGVESSRVRTERFGPTG